MNSDNLRIDADRMRANFDALAEIGSTGDGGVHRPTFSEAHLAARQWYRDRMTADGFAVVEDRAGNLSAKHAAKDAAAKTLILGSHTDSVFYGGRFDGALGVIVAYEVLQTVKDAGLALPVHLEAMDFTDEEGTLIGLTGSRAVAGALSEADVANPRGGQDRWDDGLARALLSTEGFLQAKRDPDTLAGYLELHIEQGPRLIEAGASIGIVTALVGIRSFTLTFTGRADHAGTTAMNARRDAGLGAATFTLQARSLVMDKFPEAVVNVGAARYEPGAFNIVPALAEIKVEYRAPSEAQLDHVRDALTALAHSVADALELGVALGGGACVTAGPCDPAVQAAFAAACDTLGLRHMPLLSGAGHDTQAMAQVTPAGMVFIPSTGGSHNPNEHAEWQACVDGANVMLLAALTLAEQHAHD